MGEIKILEVLSQNYKDEDKEHLEIKVTVARLAKCKWGEVQREVTETFNSYGINYEDVDFSGASGDKTPEEPIKSPAEPINKDLSSDQAADFLEATPPSRLPTASNYQQTPTEKEFVEEYNKILTEQKYEQVAVGDEIKERWKNKSERHDQQPRRVSISIRSQAGELEQLELSSKDGVGGDFYCLQEGEYYFVVPIPQKDVSQSRECQKLFDTHGHGKYLQRVITPARFKLQAEPDNRITLDQEGKGEISLQL